VPTSTAGAVAGFVSLGRPVVNAQVEVLAFHQLTAGDLLGSGVTDASGFFEVAIDGDYSGRVLIRAGGAGATYEEPSGGESTFDADDALLLTASYDHATGLAGVVVNGLSTLAVPLATAYKSAAVLPETAAAQAHDRLSEHLLRPGGFDVSTTPVADLTLGPTPWPQASTALGLFHVGLSRMAADLTAESSAPVSTLDVLQALAKDLAGDGLFDGQEGPGAALVILNQHPIDTDTTRWALAAATDAFLTAAAYEDGDLTYDILAADDGFLTLISTDQGPLYPADALVKRFDTRPPTLAFVAPSPADAAFVAGSFQVALESTDDSPLTGLELKLPDSLQLADEVVQLDAGSLTATVTPLALDGAKLTFSARAVDASGNEALQQRTLTLDLSPPQVTATLPPAFNDPATPLTGQVTDAGSGPATVTTQHAGQSYETTPDPDGVFELAVPFTEGPIDLTLVATDAAGNSTEATVASWLDLTEPLVSLQTPPPDAWIAAGEHTLVLKTEDATAITEVTAKVTAQPPAAATQADAQWTVTIVTPTEDGPFAVELKATDLAGNTGTAAVVLKRDGQPPKLTGVTVPEGAQNGGKTFVKGTNAVAEVVATDEGSGVMSVCSTPDCDGAQSPDADDTWLLTLPTPDPVNDYTITATDQAANQATLSLTLYRDDTPPTCTIAPLGNDGWINIKTLPVVVQSEDPQGAGVAKVTLTTGTTTADL